MADEPSFDLTESEMSEPVQPAPDDSSPPAPEPSPSSIVPEDGSSLSPPDAQGSEGISPAEPKVDMVPHQALHEERERRKDMEQQVRRMEERFNEFQARLQQETAQPKAAEPEIPSFDEDPASNLDGRLRMQEETAQRLQAETTQQRQQRENQEKIVMFEREFQTKEATFAAKTPDYYQATEFLRNSRFNELKNLGYQEPQARQILDSEALNYAITATNNGVDPVEMFYKVARERGYKGAAPAAAPGNVNLKELNENIERSESMGSRGSTPRESLSFDDLASMSDSDFDKATSGDGWKELWQ